MYMASCAGLHPPRHEPVALTPPVSPEVAPRKIEPDPSLYYNFLMAQVCLSQGDIKGAIGHYRSAASLDSGSTLLMFDLANLYVRTGELREAKQECLKIIEKEPNHLQAHLLLAGIYSALDNKEAAIEEYKTILRHDPDYEEVYIYLNATYCELKEFEKAKENMEDYAQLKPDSPLPYFYLGKISLQQEDYKSAENNYLRALEKDPGHESSLMELAMFYEDREKSKKAIEVYKKILTFYPRHIGAQSHPFRKVTWRTPSNSINSWINWWPTVIK
jgi:tetratricopeptide (TPR) repeat protein